MTQSFVDYARIYVKAGAGGDGALSFRREKYVPHGGPDGGDGGHGGSVWLEASRELKTLIDLKMKPMLRAERGHYGEGKNKSGRTGSDLVIKVPLGTVVSAEDGTPLADLLIEGQRFLAAAGGKGGAGNQHYATPTNQAPRKFKKGEPGEERALVLELKLIAQAGFVGLPNAGKSTLLAHLTHATPRIAPYPFTTLHPNLGVMEVDEFRRLTLADIPGLIEGASAGAGLGDRFLRHIERTSLLIHLVAPPEASVAEEATDEGGPDDEMLAAPAAGTLEERAETIAYAYDLVRHELDAYSPALAAKPEIVVLTKIDLLTPEERAAYLSALRKRMIAQIQASGRDETADPMAISAESEEGLPELRRHLIERLDAMGLIKDEE